MNAQWDALVADVTAALEDRDRLAAELARVTHERDWLIAVGPEGTADALKAYRAALNGLQELRPANPDAS